MFPDTDARGIDLLKRMLTFDPTKRITLNDVIAHPYFDNFHEANLEITVDTPPAFPWELEGDITITQVTDKILEEIHKFRTT